MATTKVHEATQAVASEPSSGNGHRVLSFADLREMPLPFEDVEIPELGGTVRIYAVRGDVRAKLAARAKAVESDREAEVLFECEVIAAAMGLQGEDAEAVKALPGVVIDRLGKVALRLTGFAPDAVEKALKDLKATPNGESSPA